MIPFTPQLQPTKDSCGQTVLAMIVGRPVAEVLPLMDPLTCARTGTYGKDLEAGLLALGKLNPRQLRLRAGVALPSPSILRIHGPKVATGKTWSGHWVLFDGEDILVPSYEVRLSLHSFMSCWMAPKGWRFTTAICWDEP